MRAGGAQPRLEDPAFAKTGVRTSELGMHLSGVARCLSLAETRLGRSEWWIQTLTKTLMQVMTMH